METVRNQYVMTNFLEIARLFKAGEVVESYNISNSPLPLEEFVNKMNTAFGKQVNLKKPKKVGSKYGHSNGVYKIGIGKGRQFYTLWSVEYTVVPMGQYLVHKTLYIYFQNLCMIEKGIECAEEKALALISGQDSIEYDDTLTGSKSYAKTHKKELITHGVATELPFGKYFGETIASVAEKDFDYILWVAENAYQEEIRKVVKELPSVKAHYDELEEKERKQQEQAQSMSVLNNLMAQPVFDELNQVPYKVSSMIYSNPRNKYNDRYNDHLYWVKGKDDYYLVNPMSTDPKRKVASLIAKYKNIETGEEWFDSYSHEQVKEPNISHVKIMLYYPDHKQGHYGGFEYYTPVFNGKGRKIKNKKVDFYLKNIRMVEVEGEKLIEAHIDAIEVN